MADISVTAGSVVPATSGNTRQMIAGTTLTAGQLVYRNSADGRAWTASTASLAASQIVGVTLDGGAAGQPVTVQTSGDYTVGGTVAIGTVYGVGDNAGGIAPVSDNGAGDFCSVFGIGITTAKIRIGIVWSEVAHA